MDINFLALKEGVWTYQTSDQRVLVADCSRLLNWDLFRFDCWLFGNSNWNMYTRRRQHLIDLRTHLAESWKCNENDFSARDSLIADFCVRAWERTRTPEMRGLPEVVELEGAYQKAKSVRRKSLSKVPSKKQRLDSRLMSHSIMLRSGSDAGY